MTMLLHYPPRTASCAILPTSVCCGGVEWGEGERGAGQRGERKGNEGEGQKKGEEVESGGEGRGKRGK